MQMMRLNATNMLIRGIMTNNLIGNFEAEAGLIPNSTDETDLEEDDG